MQWFESDPSGSSLAAMLAVGTFLWAVLCNVVLDAVDRYRSTCWATSAASLVSIARPLGRDRGAWSASRTGSGSPSACRSVCASWSRRPAWRSYAVRDEPLYPSDLHFLWQPSFLLDMASPRGRWSCAALGVVALVVGLVLVGRRLDRQASPECGDRRSRAPGRESSGCGSRVALVAVLVLVQTSQFNAPKATDSAPPTRRSGADWLYVASGRQLLRERLRSPASCSTPTPSAMEKPARLQPGRDGARSPSGTGSAPTAATPHRTTRCAGGRQRRAAAQRGVQRPGASRRRRPRRGSDARSSRRTMARPSRPGQVVGNAIGGGTANMEFEALTGMSQTLFAPQLTTPYQMLVPAYDSVAVGRAVLRRRRATDTMAVHPFLGSMYRRSAVVSPAGFRQLPRRRQAARASPRIGREPVGARTSRRSDDALRLADARPTSRCS